MAESADLGWHQGAIKTSKGRSVDHCPVSITCPDEPSRCSNLRSTIRLWVHARNDIAWHLLLPLPWYPMHRGPLLNRPEWALGVRCCEMPAPIAGIWESVVTKPLLESLVASLLVCSPCRKGGGAGEFHQLGVLEIGTAIGRGGA